MAVWKSELGIQAEQTIAMPRGAEILQVREQNGIGCIWYRFEDGLENTRELRHLITLGTGWPDKVLAGKYLGSYHLQGGALVFHVFEKKE